MRSQDPNHSSSGSHNAAASSAAMTSSSCSAIACAPRLVMIRRRAPLRVEVPASASSVGDLSRRSAACATSCSSLSLVLWPSCARTRARRAPRGRAGLGELGFQLRGALLACMRCRLGVARTLFRSLQALAAQRPCCRVPRPARAGSHLLERTAAAAQRLPPPCARRGELARRAPRDSDPAGARPAGPVAVRMASGPPTASQRHAPPRGAAERLLPARAAAGALRSCSDDGANPRR